ncbi:hypothetical protein KP509_35G019300 [Ceratopteris richardii]|uniref:Uncharacterized protein n=1 Tax=Ceratopteris richardii TaxID=49495 RepID=A0A8T2QGD9_CERRI|nr:hypothetical protein KP509_35G019300 [Ceratopteris richardii]
MKDNSSLLWLKIPLKKVLAYYKRMLFRKFCMQHGESRLLLYLVDYALPWGRQTLI